MPHDLKLWCEDCQKGYEGECEEHGPLTHVTDTEVGTRARRSIPHLLELKEGKIRTGVFAKEKLAKRLQFGPLQGLCVTEARKQVPIEQEIQNRFGIVFKLVQQNEDQYLLDTRFEEHSNWMIFVRPAESKSEQNLVAFQYKGDIFFATIKEIPVQKELKVWFSKDYAERMGAKLLSEETTKWKFRTRQRFNCIGCGLVFNSASSLANHQCSKVKQKVKFEPPTPRKRLKRELFPAREEVPRRRAVSETPLVIEPLRESQPEAPVAKKTSKLKERKLKGKEKTKIIVAAEQSESEEERPTESRVQEKASYKCPVCDKIFHSPGKLKQHSYSHTGERPFSCLYCQKAFSSRFKLGRHQLIHTGERQYQCHLCNRSFHRKDHLKNHLQIHDPNKQFKCERADCGKEYNSYMSYRKHCAVHAAEEGDLECKICLKMYDNKSDLIFHLKDHVGTRTVKSPSEKKFQCDQCDRRFFTRKDVKRHMVVHTGKRDFICSLCPQKFGRKDHLVRHIKKSHGVSERGRFEVVTDPLTAPGPSWATQAVSPEAATFSSASGSSGEQTFSSIIMGEALTPAPGTAKTFPSAYPPPAGAFPPEFRFFEEGIKEEPEQLTASMEESFGPGGDDLSRFLGMYLPSGSINMPEPPLLEAPAQPETAQVELQTLHHVEGSREPEHLGPLMIRESQIFEEAALSPPPLIPLRSTGDFPVVSPEVQPLQQSEASGTLLSRGFQGLLEEQALPQVSGSPKAESPPSTSPPSTTTTTTSTSGSTTTTLPGFEQAFP